MPGWFSAFIAFLILFLAGLILYYLMWNHRVNRGPKLATLYVESKDMYETENDCKEARLGRLQNGMVMWKCGFGSNARRLKRVVLLGGTTIAVSKSDINSRSKLSHTDATEVVIDLRDILAIQLGPLSRAFNYHMDNITRKELCFSILTSKRTLDLEALTDKDCEDWYLWLQSKFKGHQKWAGLPFYTCTTLNFAFANMRAGKMPPMAFSYNDAFADEIRKQIDSPRNRPDSPRRQQSPRKPSEAPPPSTRSITASPKTVHTIDIDCSAFPHGAQ